MKKNKILTLSLVGALMLTGFFGFTSEVLASESVMYPDSYQNSDNANPERYTPNADDLSRFVYSDEMEAKESVVVQDYLYYMEDGEVVVEPISGASIDYKGKVSYSYGGYTYTVGDFTVNGYQAYCLEHDASTPGDGTSNDGGNPYNDPEIQSCLYYGWGGQGQIGFTSRNQGIVVTSLVLDELYTNQNNTGAISNCPQYKELENLARNSSAPEDTFTFSDSTLTTTVSGGTQTSQKTTMNGAVENKVTLSIPSSVTIYVDTDSDSGYEKTQKGGKVTIKGGDTVWFSAPSNYETDYNTGNLKGTIRPVNPFVVKMDNSSLQDLGFAPYADPPVQNGFTVQFKNYQQKVTVNHIDQRTGDVIDTDTYTKNTGDNYTYSPRTDLKKDGIPYTPVSTTPISGTVGTSPITINFYYTLPVVQVGLDSVNIPTAPADEGLDVYTKLIFDDVYDAAMTDTVNPKFTLALYEDSTKIASTQVAPATHNPSQEIVLHVPSSMLNVNEKNTYTVKIEGYDSKNIYCTAKEITIDAYTASEETIEVNASTTKQELAYEGVAGTYEKYGQTQQTAYESFSIPNITQLGKEKSGFGFELPISFYYGFDDPSGQFVSQVEPPELTMNVPNEIVDTTHIEYETDGVTSEVPLEEIPEAGTEGSIPYSDEKKKEQEKLADVASYDSFSSIDKYYDTGEEVVVDTGSFYDYGEYSYLELSYKITQNHVDNTSTVSISASIPRDPEWEDSGITSKEIDGVATVEKTIPHNENGSPSQPVVYVSATGWWGEYDTADYESFDTYEEYSVSGVIVIPEMEEPLVEPVTGLEVTNVTSDSITVAWDDYSGVRQFNVYVNEVLEEELPYGSTSYTIEYLEPNTTYTIGIEVESLAGHTSRAVEVTATTLAEEDLPVTGLEVTNVTSDSITVAWDDYSGEEEFNIYLNDELYGTAEGDATSYTIDYLDPNTTYTIGIAPVTSDGTIAPITEITTTTLTEGEIQPITGLEVVEVTTNSITVGWDSYSGEDQFNVYVNGELYDVAGFEATSYTLEGLEPNTTYTIGIEAVMSGGTTAPMAEVTATTLAEEVEETPDLPQVPMSVTATSSEYTIELSWADGSYADSYNVYLNGDLVTNVTGTSYTFGNLTPNTTYTVGVSSVNEDGESEIAKLTVTTLTIPMNMSDSQTYQLPHVWCEEMSGELFTDEQRLNNDPRITDDLIDGGNKFYTPIWCDLGKYPISVTNEEPIGANEVNIEINYVLDVYAQMYGTVDSVTIEDDHIIWRPVDLNNPFPEGKPENWTDEDVDWLTSDNFVW